MWALIWMAYYPWVLVKINEKWRPYPYAGALCAHRDETLIELETTQDEQSITQKANDEDSSLNIEP